MVNTERAGIAAVFGRLGFAHLSAGDDSHLRTIVDMKASRLDALLQHLGGFGGDARINLDFQRDATPGLEQHRKGLGHQRGIDVGKIQGLTANVFTVATEEGTLLGLLLAEAGSCAFH